MQHVVIDGKTSEWGQIQAGIPKGSVLGQLLFLTYMNDITDNILAPIKLFSDGTSLYITFSNINEATN